MLSISRIRLVIPAVLVAVAALALVVPAVASAEFSLTINEEGGAGTYECEVDGEPAEACESGDEFPEDSEVVVFPEPDEGFEFVGFTGDCGFIACELEMDSNKEITAIFESESGVFYALNLETGGPGGGEILCKTGGPAEQCDLEYEAGSELTLVAEPEEGSEFLEWGGDCEGEITETCDITIDEERTAAAVFGLEPPTTFPLEIAIDGSGTVKCDAEEGPGTCQEEYPEGADVTLIATPIGGATFVEWGGDCTGEPEECVLTMDTEHFAEAIFEGGSPPTVTSVSPNKGTTAGGTVVTITGTNLTGAT
jgi:hypothetical protein